MGWLHHEKQLQKYIEEATIQQKSQLHRSDQSSYAGILSILNRAQLIL